jgi:hypothetical protein
MVDEEQYCIDILTQISAVTKALAEFGARPVIDCHSLWASDQYHWFGVEEYPSLEAVQGYAERMAALGWLQYIDAFSLLGSKWEMPAELQDAWPEA